MHPRSHAHRAQSCGLWSPCYFSWTSLATLSASYLVLMALASSLCVPGGLFLPSIMVGAGLWVVPSSGRGCPGPGLDCLLRCR